MKNIKLRVIGYFFRLDDLVCKINGMYRNEKIAYG